MYYLNCPECGFELKFDPINSSCYGCKRMSCAFTSIYILDNKIDTISSRYLGCDTYYVFISHQPNKNLLIYRRVEQYNRLVYEEPYERIDISKLQDYYLYIKNIIINVEKNSVLE